MHHEFSYDYSRDLVGIATRRFIRRRVGLPLASIGVFGLASLAMATVSGREHWFWLAGLALVIVLASLTAWFRYYRTSMSVCDTMPDPRVDVQIDPESITFRTSEHTSTMKWSRIKRIWRFPEVLFLFAYDNTSGTILPVDALGPEAQQFIEDRVREHGGVVS